jgi:hypothetical protein
LSVSDDGAVTFEYEGDVVCAGEFRREDFAVGVNLGDAQAGESRKFAGMWGEHTGGAAWGEEGLSETGLEGIGIQYDGADGVTEQLQGPRECTRGASEAGAAGDGVGAFKELGQQGRFRGKQMSVEIGEADRHDAGFKGGDNVLDGTGDAGGDEP